MIELRQKRELLCGHIFYSIVCSAITITSQSSPIISNSSWGNRAGGLGAIPHIAGEFSPFGA
jgi:hypothetical protein